MGCCYGDGVVSVEGEGEGAVEEVCEEGEGGGRAGEIEEEEGGYCLILLVLSSIPNMISGERCNQNLRASREHIQHQTYTSNTPSKH